MGIHKCTINKINTKQEQKKEKGGRREEEVREGGEERRKRKRGGGRMTHSLKGDESWKGLDEGSSSPLDGESWYGLLEKPSSACLVERPPLNSDRLRGSGS